MISVDGNLVDALHALMQAKDRAQLFQYEPRHVERLSLLIRAVQATRREIEERQSCATQSSSTSEQRHSA